MTSTPKLARCEENYIDLIQSFSKQVYSVESELSSLLIELAKVKGLVGTKLRCTSQGNIPIGGKVRDSINRLTHGLADLRGKLYEILSSSSC
jgi:hypothetical protein